MPTSLSDSDYSEIMERAKENAKQSYKKARHDYLFYAPDPTRLKEVRPVGKRTLE